MSDYSKRWDELQELVRGPEERDLAAAGEGGAEQAQTLARYTTAMDGLRSYCDWRKQTLNQALWSMASSSGSADSRQSAWQSVFSGAASDAQSRVIDSVKDAQERAPALLEFAATVAQEESQFFLRLGQIPLSTFRGRVIAATNDFQVAAAKLKDEWDKLGDEARSAGEKAQAVCAQIREIVYDTVKKLVEEDRGLTEKLNNVKPDPNKPPNDEKAALIEMLKAVVQLTMYELNKYTKPMSEYIDQLSDIASKEELFVVQFTEIRATVAEFLKNTNLTSMATEYNEATAKALDLAADCAPSGARQDAIDFVKDAVGLMDPLLNEFNRLYTDFIDQNRGIFVGYVDLSRLDDLLKISAAESTCEDLEKSNIETTLNDFLDHTVNWNVSIDGLSDEDKKDFKDIIRTQLEPLSHGIVEANEDRYIDIIRKLIKDRLVPQRRLLEESKGASA
jgi:hypothetical protein